MTKKIQHFALAAIIWIENKVPVVYLSDYMKIRQEHLSLPVYWLQSHRASPGLEYWLEYWRAWYLKQFTGWLKTIHFQWRVHSWHQIFKKTWIVKCSSQCWNELVYCVVYFATCSLSFQDLSFFFKFKLQWNVYNCFVQVVIMLCMM